jgi:hypothetical protein
VLENVRRSLDFGLEAAWTFLIRTPDLVEAGVRAELTDRLDNSWHIRKETIPLGRTGMTVAPDVVIGDVDAVADVKYKRTITRWRRADLYEATAFAVAAGTHRGALINFRAEGDPVPPATVTLGDTEVRSFVWDARDNVAPSVAAARLADDFANWLSPLL